jgi:hypothetical protein
MKLLLLFLLIAVSLRAAPPVVFYEDITQGAKTGGENNHGVYVTIKGKNFGASQGGSSITLGSGSVTVKSWSDSQIVFQPGPSGATGDIVVTVSSVSSVCSETGNCTFTVQGDGHTAGDAIYCISQSAGNDSNNGRFTTDGNGGTGCFLTLLKVAQLMQATTITSGDTVYFGQSASDPYQTRANAADNCSVWAGSAYAFAVDTACYAANTQSHPMQFVGYPGNTAIFGGSGTGYGTFSTSGALWFQYRSSPPTNSNWWTFANIEFLWADTSDTNIDLWAIAVDGGPASDLQGLRFVNDDIQCPDCSSPGIGFNSARMGCTNVTGKCMWFFGNYFHNISAGPGLPDNRRTVPWYTTNDSNEWEFGWNEIDGTGTKSRGCMHMHSSPFDTTGAVDGFPMYGYSIHDNKIHGCQGFGFNLGSNDPGKGDGIQFYNNLLYDIGNCETPLTVNPSTYPVFSFAFWSTNDYNWQIESGQFEIRNNTIYNFGDCGAHGSANTSGTSVTATSGQFPASLTTITVNAVAYNFTYISPTTGTLGSSAGTQTGVAWSVQNADSSAAGFLLLEKAPTCGSQCWSLPTKWTHPAYSQQLCNNGACNFTHYTGTLPTLPIDGAGQDTHYRPGMMTFVAYTNNGFGTPTEIAYVDATSGHGAGGNTYNVLQPGTGIIGTVIIDTPANSSTYDFTWASAPPAAGSVQFEVIHNYHINLKNNVVYMKAGQDLWLATSNFNGPLAAIIGDHGEWYNVDSVAFPWNFTQYSTANDATGDPLFVSTSTPDLHLQSGSPAKVAGTTLSYPTRDYDALLRPQGSAWALGAFEFPAVVNFNGSLHSGPRTMSGPSKHQ